MWPEFDRFGLFTPDEAVARVAKSLRPLIAGISLDFARGAMQRFEMNRSSC